MRHALALAVVVALCAAAALAGDGNVSQGTLSALGLGGMQTMSDAEGMQVRGMASSFGMAKGTSLILGQLLTPDTKNTVVGNSTNEVDANAETTQSGVVLTVTKDHGVDLALTLDVTFADLTQYVGVIVGATGGAGGMTASN
jgi:opacity protein-like surface antigen